MPNGKHTSPPGDKERNAPDHIPSWRYANHGNELEIDGTAPSPLVEEAYTDVSVTLESLAGVGLSVRPYAFYVDEYVPRVDLELSASDTLTLEYALTPEKARAVGEALHEAAREAEAAVAAEKSHQQEEDVE